LVSIVCSACGLLPQPVTCDPETQDCDAVWVTVTGPADWHAPQDFVLEIGTNAWPIQEGDGGGVVAVELAPEENVIVRLVQPRPCHAVVEFAALPGSNWVIRFAADGTPRVEDWTGEGSALGPALNEGQSTGCIFDR
jgi:hypothetical protein